MSAGLRSLDVNVGVAAGADLTGGGAGEADGVAAGADPTGGGAGEAVFGPVFSVVDFRRSRFLASCLLLWTTLYVLTVSERRATQ